MDFKHSSFAWILIHPFENHELKTIFETGIATSLAIIIKRMMNLYICNDSIGGELKGALFSIWRQRDLLRTFTDAATFA